MVEEVIFRTTDSVPKRYDVVIGHYEKGAYTCFTLRKRRVNGNHIIIDHPTALIFSIAREHMPHEGSTLTQGEPPHLP